MLTNLVSLTTIFIEGDDAFRFLQGQLSCDIRLTKPDSTLKGILCNNKGRVIASFWLTQDQSGYKIVLPKELSLTVMQHLQKYARFSKIQITRQDESPEKLQNLLENIREGFALLFPEHSEKFTPHELSYPQIGVVSFDKGCYVGQEIIARVHYRGKTKQHLYHVEFHSLIETESLEMINFAKRDDGNFEALVVASEINLPGIKVIKSYE